jgi:uncharacterized protein (DUF362 family)
MILETVSLIYGDHIQDMVQQLVSTNGALDTLRSQDTVVIKPNLVASRRDWQGVDTDPRVVEALVIELKKSGVDRITIGDGSGMGNSATKAFKILGYHAMAKRYGLKLVDFEKDRFVRRPVKMDGPFDSLEIAQTVAECDFLINVPVMKAHAMALMTCSLKNLKGVMPRATKTAFHGVDLSKAIAQLNTVLTADLIVVDGIRGDLSHETGRTPVTMNRILMGTNPVAVDSVVADMLGYEPRTIRHIADSADAGLGTCDLKKIHIQALNKPLIEEKLTPPPHYAERFPCRINADGACCTCLGNLLFALERLKEKGALSSSQCFVVGQKPGDLSSKKMTIAVGQCAVECSDADIRIDKCPPSAGFIYRKLAS